MAKNSQTKYYFSVVGVIVLIILAVVAVLNASNLQSVLSPTAVTSKPAAGLEPITSSEFVDPFDDGVIDEANWTIVTRGDAVVKEDKKGLPNERLNIRVPAGLAEGDLGKYGALQFNTPILADFAIKAEVRKVDTRGELGRGGVRFVTDSSDAGLKAVIKRRTQPGRDELIFSVRRPDGSLLDSEAVKIKADKVTVKLERVGSESQPKFRAWYKLGVDKPGLPWTKIKISGQDEAEGLGGTGYLQLFSANSKGDSGSVVKARFDDAKILY